MCFFFYGLTWYFEGHLSEKINREIYHCVGIIWYTVKIVTSVVEQGDMTKVSGKHGIILCSQLIPDITSIQGKLSGNSLT